MGEKGAMKMIRGKWLAGFLVSVLVLGCASPAQILMAAETDAVSLEQQLKGAEADSEGFIIENGILTGYTGSGGAITIPDGVTAIGDRAFFCCSDLTSVTIPDGVTSIGKNAFAGCGDLGSLTLPDSVTYIGDRAFYNCSVLTQIEIPEHVTNIGNGVFALCYQLNQIKVAQNNPNYTSENGILYDKEKHILLGCPGGKKGEIQIPDGVTVIEANAFAGCLLSDVTMPDSVTSIGDYAFYMCDSLENITFSDNLTSIGRYAFFQCYDLATIDITGQIKKIGDYAFYESGLKDISIQEGVESIGNAAFAQCYVLKKVILPNSVTKIGTAAFENDMSLSSVTLSEYVTLIGEYAFAECDALVITCPKNSYADTYATSQSIPCNYSGEVSVLKEQTITVTADEVEKKVGDAAFLLNASTDGDGTLTFASDHTEVVTVDQRGMVTIIGAGTAHIKVTASGTATCKAAEKTVTIIVKSADTSGQPNDATNPDTSDKTGTEASPAAVGTVFTSGTESYKVTKQGAEVALVKTTRKAATMTIPATVKKDQTTYKVTSIAANTFKNNKKLTKVVIGKNVASIGNSTFYGCKKLKTVTIGTGVTKIGKEAFKGCTKLSGITIKSTKLKSVGKNAFKGISSGAKIKVPSKKLTAYKKLLKGKGQSSKVKIVK